MKPEKMIAVALCVTGVSSVAYGMAQEKDVPFIAGLILIVGGYFIIRRKLKGKNRKGNG